MNPDKILVPQKLSDFPEVRARIQPLPDLHYPAPWRVAETKPDGKVVVVCASGHYTCEAPTAEAAQIIVLAVNAWAASPVETQSGPTEVEQEVDDLVDMWSTSQESRYYVQGRLPGLAHAIESLRTAWNRRDSGVS